MVYFWIEILVYFWGEINIYLDLKRKCFLFGSWIYFRKVGGYAPDYLHCQIKSELLHVNCCVKVIKK